jgi:hypothetical protein
VDRARLAAVAVLGAGHPGARHLQQRAVQGSDGAGQADLLGGHGEPITAGLTPGGGNEAGPAEIGHELLEVGMGQPLAAGDGGQRKRCAVVGAGQGQQDANAVLGTGPDLHGRSTITSSPSTWTG